MNIDKDELKLASAFIKAHFDRIVDWAVGDIRKCCRMKNDGTCSDSGALIGAFILWTCAVEYFGGLFTGFASQGATKARFKHFIEKYMKRYDYEKVEDLRWSLSHYYSPHHFVLYHENDLDYNKGIHLTSSDKGIMFHLGWAIKDLEDAVSQYRNDLLKCDRLKIKLWRYYKVQLPIMPLDVKEIYRSQSTTLSSLATGTAIPISASGTISPDEWFKK